MFVRLFANLIEQHECRAFHSYCAQSGVFPLGLHSLGIKWCWTAAWHTCQGSVPATDLGIQQFQ